MPCARGNFTEVLFYDSGMGGRKCSDYYSLCKIDSTKLTIFAFDTTVDLIGVCTLFVPSNYTVHSTLYQHKDTTTKNVYKVVGVSLTNRTQ